MRYGLLFLLLVSTASAQESKLHADFRGEAERVSAACRLNSFPAIAGCLYEVFTDHPLHIAAGNLPPQNEFGFGAAFVAGRNTKDWRSTLDIDAVASPNLSFRAGGYMKLIHTPPQKIVVHTPTTKSGASAPGARPISLVHPYTTIYIYAQGISLNQLFYFGEGNDTTLAGQSIYGMTQTIVGVSAIKPVFEWEPLRALNLALVGEANGRFVSVRGEHGQSKPSIEQLYTEETAPGLTSQPPMAQFGEGLRIRPSIAERLQLDYLGMFQQFAASADTHRSFLRWTADLNHTFSLYGFTRSAGAPSPDAHGPDECAPLSAKCPPVSNSRNLNGSISFRLLLSESSYSSRNLVPFYFQPTLGGSDINNAMVLPSYLDYRFRAPNSLLLRGSFEHSIWGPLGLSFMADQAKVATMRSEIAFNHLRHSFAGGVSLRAGGFPIVSLMFAWGGEGHHNIFSMNSSLLGGSSRPSLF